MKNGLGEDITEGKISYPIVYCFSLLKGKRMSVCSNQKIPNLQHASLHNLMEEKDSEIKQNQESGKIDLFDQINNSNIYSNKKILKNSKQDMEMQTPISDLRIDMEELVGILQEKTKDRAKISKAIKILKSK